MGKRPATSPKGNNKKPAATFEATAPKKSPQLAKGNDKRAAAPANARKPKHKKSDDSTALALTDYAGATTFFWKEDGGNGYLYQWYRCSFTDPEHHDLTFSCAEQYMMWRKAMLFGDAKTASDIMKCSSPCKQKALARECANFDEAKWTEERSAIVRRGNWLKFTQCTNVTSLKMEDKGEPVPLRDLLLATKGDLAEASPFDAVWGIGFKAEEAMVVSRARWGKNMLGIALMCVRSELEKFASGGTIPDMSALSLS
ncbi:hypothetical protein LTR85_004612 [Meristemomyces frigidus]|nr:hypothetical protein LTR85_004612 [Meristemomyces frigidus]